MLRLRQICPIVFPKAKLESRLLIEAGSTCVVHEYLTIDVIYLFTGQEEASFIEFYRRTSSMAICGFCGCTCT